MLAVTLQGTGDYIICEPCGDAQIQSEDAGAVGRVRAWWVLSKASGLSQGKTNIYRSVQQGHMHLVRLVMNLEKLRVLLILTQLVE